MDNNNGYNSDFEKEDPKSDIELINDMDTKKGDNKGFVKGYVCCLISIAVVVFLVFSINNVLANFKIKDIKDTTEETSDSKDKGIINSKVVQKLQAIDKIVEAYFLDEADDTKLAEGMYAGYMAGLDDPYSVYYTKEEFDSLMESTNGTYCGIGVTVSQNVETGIITLVKPFEGSPGEEAGILPGDVLYKVDGEEVTGRDLSEVVSKIKGEAGTTVEITVARTSINDYITMTVERREIEVPTISYKMLEDNIGYIEVAEFDEVTDEQFSKALAELTNQGMEGLVVDLRDNPGGVLDVVVNMLDEILPEGMIVYTEDKYGNREEYKSDEEHQLNVPMTVLVNGNSASASEIFAGAVKDYGVGTIVGTTTFGKGIVQRLFDLGDGTALKLTISKYYTPNGNNIHGIGIEPDVEVELDEAVASQVVRTEEEDNQLQKAIEILKQ